MEFNNLEFFNKSSKFYNLMINPETAINRKCELFNNLNIINMPTADLGCGSGNDSIALSMCGNRVDAFDPSSQMLELARRNAISKGLSIEFYNYEIQGIPEKFNQKYSFICSLGNTVANISPKNLNKVFQKIKDLLQKNGQALIQILNYDLILTKKERIISINKNEENNFIRFYDFEEDHLKFNILKFSSSNLNDHEIISTKIYPHSFTVISKFISGVGFSGKEFFGNFNFEVFDPKHSNDLIILLKK